MWRSRFFGEAPFRNVRTKNINFTCTISALRLRDYYHLCNKPVEPIEDCNVDKCVFASNALFIAFIIEWKPGLTIISKL